MPARAVYVEKLCDLPTNFSSPLLNAETADLREVFIVVGERFAVVAPRRDQQPHVASELFRRQVGQEAQPAEVQPEDRPLPLPHLPARPQDRSIAPEDNDQLRGTLARLINKEEGFKCLSQYPSAEAALEALPKDKPDVVLMDINLPGMNGVECVRRLKQIAPVFAVRGNVDTQPWAQELPRTTMVEADGANLYVLHNLRELDLEPAAAGCNAVITGHTHQPEIVEKNGVLYLNPGSAGPRRFSLPITLATLELTRSGIRPVIHDLEPAQGRPRPC